jgi:hypothetical protein
MGSAAGSKLEVRRGLQPLLVHSHSLSQRWLAGSSDGLQEYVDQVALILLPLTLALDPAMIQTPSTHVMWVGKCLCQRIWHIGWLQCSIQCAAQRLCFVGVASLGQVFKKWILFKV